MQLVDLALVLCVVAMWMMMMMMMMSDLADSLFGHLEAVRCWLVGRSGGGWEGIKVGSTVSGEAGKLRVLLLQHFCCMSMRQDFVSLSLDRENLFSQGRRHERMSSHIPWMDRLPLMPVC